MKESSESSSSSDTPAGSSSSSTPPTNNASGGGGWIWDTFRSKFDEQRISRLNQCRVLQDLLQECRRRPPRRSFQADDSDLEKKKDESQHRSLEDVPMGIRSVRYYQWRDMENYDTGCVREAHALWNCRGVALGCGKDCVALRRCLLKENPETILAHGKTAYGLDENDDDVSAALDHGSSIACAKLQLNLKSCVAKAATELEERCKKSKA
jgi:hypothetical protein